MFNLNLTVLVLLIVFLYICLKKVLDKSLIRIRNNYKQTKDEYERLLSENTQLKRNNSNLKNILDETMALYDITKQISKSLEEDKMFDFFKDEINKYVKVSDCKFLKGEIELSLYREYITLPLKINGGPIGYLLASSVTKEDKNKFYILAQQFFLGIKRATLYQKVQELAITDSLTKVFTRRFVLERFDEEIERSKKFNHRFSCLMADIDHFKNYNDNYGHLVGDALLKEISKRIKENIREIDLIGRYGGEEFLLILIEIDKNHAKFAAERLRQAVEYKDIRVYDENLKVTISIGISSFPDDASDADGLIEKADLALYQAKQTGRNKVCLYGE